MTTVTLVAATFAFFTAVMVVWANPTRLTNRIFSVIWILFAVWFTLVHEAVKAENAIASGQPANAEVWLRANSALIAFAPALVWFLKDCIATACVDSWVSLRRTAPVFGVSIILAAVCYQESFILTDAVSGKHYRGSSYAIYILVQLVIYIWLVYDCGRQLKRQRGIRRLELQLLALTTGSTCLAGTALVGIGNLLLSEPIRRSTLFVVLGGFALTAWAITAHRIFDTKQVLSTLAHRIVLITSLSLAASILFILGTDVMPTFVAMFVSVAIACSIGFWLDRKSREWLKLTGEYLLTDMRRSVIEIARTEPDPTRLVSQYVELLRGHSHASFVTLASNDPDQDLPRDVFFVKELKEHSILWELEWATPESLQRRRSTARFEALNALLHKHSIGLIITIPRGSPMVSLIVAFGTKINEWPFTYPEVQRFQNVAELMDNILTRSRLTTQAALRAKTEHLAMMSRGLAHDLKNLLTPMSSFLVHTEGKFPPNSPEAEVHDAAQRSVQIMGEYVREAHFFSEQLTLQLESVTLRAIFASLRDITHARAKGHNVSLEANVVEDGTVVVDRVLVQRLLGNLVVNAIDASPPGQAVVLTGRVHQGLIEFQVKDQGCGIPPENLSRIFDAYFTTKEYGEDVRGFGLGLTICQKIVELHGGHIHVESMVGKGTTFTIILPARSSAVDASPVATAADI